LAAYIQKLRDLQTEIETPVAGSSAQRQKDKFGILWHEKHMTSDATEMLATVSAEHPLSIAFLDMNGLKALNDGFDHDVGDRAIMTFFQVIFNSLGKKGGAYRRGDAADEVVVLLPKCDATSAMAVLTLLLRRLKNAPFFPDDSSTRRHELTASCGLITETDPKKSAVELLNRDPAASRASQNSSG
jgi:diguanylate cyclase (GGDEF)-like protein